MMETFLNKKNYEIFNTISSRGVFFEEMSSIGCFDDLEIHYLCWRGPSLFDEHFQKLAAPNLTEGVNFSKFSIVQK